MLLAFIGPRLLRIYIDTGHFTASHHGETSINVTDLYAFPKNTVLWRPYVFIGIATLCTVVPELTATGGSQKRICSWRLRSGEQCGLRCGLKLLLSFNLNTQV